ncbi:MAG: hypothetical protein HOW97_03230 [Catenulispora sp.]|nr:hypothetical protein [Catenulispora sp.]NUR57244.1 hypothetical protein [Catenulispora sp.]
MIIDGQAGDLLSAGNRTGEILWLFPGRASAMVCWRDTGRTTRFWPGADARIQHRDLAELEVPEPRRMTRTIPAMQTSDKDVADTPHPALR